MIMGNQQKRATFEDVCNAQDRLLIFIDECINNNIPLSSEKRNEFISLFRIATLGLGAEHAFYIQGKHMNHTLGDVGHAAYWLAYRTEQMVVLSHDFFEIKEFWLKLRDYCFKIFSQAQELSIKISKEQTWLGPAKAGRV